MAEIRNGSNTITVIFLLYHAPRFVPGLVEAIVRQRHPRLPRAEAWLRVMFVDNGSTDSTGRILAEEIAKAGSPPHWQIVTNMPNLGYAGAVNKAFRLAETPYALTCHCDCLFGSDDYVATMLDLLERTPKAAAITGQAAIPAGQPLPFAEKVNLVANLMDVFPAETNEELVPVGFAEGRCDAFRLDAVKAAGYYDTSHHSAGEDQILSARMRAAGYEVYQAPRLSYVLSVSDEQDTVGKLIRHTELFGEKHPILMLRGGAGSGALGGPAGANRRARSLLRFSHLAAVVAYLALSVGLFAGVPLLAAALPLAAVALLKAWLFSRHLRAVRFTLGELVQFVLLQPVLDIAYARGFLRGLWYALQGRSETAIAPQDPTR
jgi:glycosyl transferase family 2